MAGALAVDGIVYLSDARAFHRVTVPDLYNGLTKLLSEETVKRLDAVYKNPHGSTEQTIQALAEAFHRAGLSYYWTISKKRLRSTPVRSKMPSSMRLCAPC